MTMIKSKPNFCSYVGLTKEEIKIITSNPCNLYQKKIQPKRKFGEDQTDGYGDDQIGYIGIKWRELCVPEYKLKRAQQRINNLVQEISLPDNMFGSIPGKNSILNAGEHLNHKYFLTIDLKNFFPNITARQVFSMLYSNGFSKDTANIITSLTTLKGFLPQGAPSSPVIANLVIVNMVREINTFLKPFNITFTSYVDDLAFSANTCFKKLIEAIISLIKRNDFFPSYKKIHYRTNGCEITGLIVAGNELKITPLMRRKAYTNKDLDIYVKRVEGFNQKRKLACKK